MMGSDDGNALEALSMKYSSANSFYLGKYQVTQAQWEAVMGNNPSRFRAMPLSQWRTSPGKESPRVYPRGYTRENVVCGTVCQ